MKNTGQEKMKLKKITSRTLTILSMLIFMIMACEEEPESIYDPDVAGGETPVVNTVAPDSNYSADNVTFSGIGVVQIIGENFSAVKDYNNVFFDGVPGEVLSSTETTLYVRVPNISGDSIGVKVAVQGAFHFGEYATPFKIVAAVEEIGGFDDLDAYMASVACDSVGNAYASTGKLVYVVKPDSLRKLHNTTILTGISSMKMGPDNYLYFIMASALSRLTPEGVTEGLWLKVLPEKLVDLDYNATGNMFVAAEGGNIYTFNTTAETYIADGSYLDTKIQSIRVFDNYLYVAGTLADSNDVVTQKSIWRSPITGDNLGTKEVYVDFSDFDTDGSLTVSSITFSADGELFIGNMSEPALIMYDNGTLQPFYAPILNAGTSDMTWDDGKYLYVSRVSVGGTTQRLVKVNMGRSGAVYYGRD